MSDSDRNSTATLLQDLRNILGPEGLLADASARLVYARDASHLTLGKPLAVALPGDALQLEQVVRLCRDVDVPIVCRGSGTGLSGGAVPNEGALVVGTARLNNLGSVNISGRRLRVGPGVLNEGVSRHASAAGLHFAPDPSSQSAATIGGNIAENAGGPHCLRHGVTLQHLLGMEWCDASGRPLVTGRGLSAERGLHLVSLLCGSEGTLGLVTAADLKLVADPADVTTLLAFFPDLEDAVGAVVGLLGAGLAPVAVEIVDQAMLAAVEQAFGFGFPTDVEAAMIVEFVGQVNEVAEDSDRAASLLEEKGAREVRRAVDAEERAELWKCRKKAFGAVGRLAPSYVTMDVVVPLGELPGLVREIQVIKDRHGVEIATAFHAGDGNLHPGVHYDDQDPEQTRRAHAAADEIIQAALRRQGSVTGEHGVGIEKLHAVSWQLDGETARLQRAIKDVFDPGNLLNPGKLNAPADADFARVQPVPGEPEFQWANLTVRAPAGASLSDIQMTALEKGFWIPVGVFTGAGSFGLGQGTTVGDLVAELLPGPGLCPAGSARDYLLELWAETGDGRLFHTGAPVFKNVAGYDLAHMLCGSGGVYVRPRAATFQLRPVPECAGYWRFELPNDGGLAGRLDSLTEYLAARDDGLGGPVMIIDAAEGRDLADVICIIPGRSRPWDLGQVGEDLVRILGVKGPTIQHQKPFGRAGDLLSDELMPGWALHAATWTVYARTSMEEGGRGLPSGTKRWIWQSAPRLAWSPDPGKSGAGWHAEPFRDEGGILAASAPPEGVPRDFLKKMKTIFDPHGSLDMPAWMEDAHG